MTISMTHNHMSLQNVAALRHMADVFAALGGSARLEGGGLLSSVVKGARGLRLGGTTEIDDAWVSRFHTGDNDVLTEVYEAHFDSVLGACRRFLREADAETCAQEVFLRMVSEPSFRQNFKGGSPRAWLCTVARNRSIDTLRKRGREDISEPSEIEQHAGVADGERFVEQAEARRIVQTFRREALPAKWAAVFEARFIKQLSQREAAADVGVSRTTLAYQEMRVRSLFEKFVLTHRRGEGAAHE